MPKGTRMPKLPETNFVQHVQAALSKLPLQPEDDGLKQLALLYADAIDRAEPDRAPLDMYDARWDGNTAGDRLWAGRQVQKLLEMERLLAQVQVLKALGPELRRALADLGASPASRSTSAAPGAPTAAPETARGGGNSGDGALEELQDSWKSAS